jgi:hypothetical protein
VFGIAELEYAAEEGARAHVVCDGGTSKRLDVGGDSGVGDTGGDVRWESWRVGGEETEEAAARGALEGVSGWCG